MRMMTIAAAACALAACGAAEGTDARAAARSAEVAVVDADAADSAAQTDAAPADPSLGFRLHEARQGSVDSITVTRGGRIVQTLRPSANEVPAHAARDRERISRIDLDYDGHADLAFVTELSMAGSRSEYWRWDPETGRFATAGVYETLQPDSAARAFTTHVRGGHAGRLWTASRWQWMDGALVEVRREEQDVAEDGDAYVHVVQERRGEALVETSRDTLAGEEVRAGATWMEP